MKRSTTTRLLLMGAAPLLFTACQNEPEVRQGLYTTVEACTRETGDAASCKQAFDSAQKQSADQAPRYATREQCKVDWARTAAPSSATARGTRSSGR